VNELAELERGGEFELVDAFEARALEIAASAAAPNTRRAYATAYRLFAAFLRDRYGEACVERVTVAAVAAWRDQLQAAGLAPSSVAQRVCAVRRLGASIGADPLVARVRCAQVQQERPRALSDR
jgi:site-specific recombinase XerD